MCATKRSAINKRSRSDPYGYVCRRRHRHTWGMADMRLMVFSQRSPTAIDGCQGASLSQEALMSQGGLLH